MSEARKPKTAPRVVHAAVEFVAAPAVPKRHRTRWILGDPDADAVEQEVEEHVRGRRGKDAKPTAERKAKDVERFELLAKATAKVPTVAPRKLYVDKRDGSIGVITARDLGDKLLEREAIANETAVGVRPKVVLCEVCKCVVKVVARGAIPRACPKHRASRLCPRGCGKAVDHRAKSCNACRTPEERSEAVCKRNASKTPEQRSEMMRKRNAAMTPEQRSDRARKANASRTPEQRSEVSRRINASMTPEQRSNIAQRRQRAKTPETRRREARKSAATRRAKAAAEKAGEQ